jgi:membrane protein implicated in regulation of membrane protease activity
LASLFLLGLAFLGLIITNIRPQDAWKYWRVLSISFGLVALALSWHLRSKGHHIYKSTIWHEIFHWGAVVGTVYAVSIFVDIGLMSGFLAGIVMVLILGLATFIAGIYIENTFLLVGLVLGAFSVVIAMFSEYLYAILLPVIVVAVGISFWLSYRKRHKKAENKDDKKL